MVDMTRILLVSTIFGIVFGVPPQPISLTLAPIKTCPNAPSKCDINAPCLHEDWANPTCLNKIDYGYGVTGCAAGTFFCVNGNPPQTGCGKRDCSPGSCLHGNPPDVTCFPMHGNKCGYGMTLCSNTPQPTGNTQSPTGNTPSPTNNTPSPTNNTPSPTNNTPSPTNGTPSPTGQPLKNCINAPTKCVSDSAPCLHENYYDNTCHQKINYGGNATGCPAGTFYCVASGTPQAGCGIRDCCVGSCIHDNPFDQTCFPKNAQNQCIHGTTLCV